MRRTCEISGVQFVVSDEDIQFYEKISPVIGGSKLLIPPPRLCPDERQRRRLAHRNERFLFKTTSALSSKPIISAYSPDLDLKICEKSEWLNLDNKDFGRDYDFSRPFFDQFAELQRETYKCALIQDGEFVNSEYNHFCGWLKNCHLMFDTGKCEDCIYGVLTVYAKNCLDTLYLYQTELCYNSIRLQDCYQVFHSTDCTNTNFSAYLDDCIGCSHCLCSTNLRNKEYYAFNEPVGKEAFEKIWAEYFSGSHQKQAELKAKFDEILQASPRRPVHILNCENSAGDYLTRCENVAASFNCNECKDCRYCYDITSNTTDCYDCATFGEGMQYCYELSACGGAKGKAEISNCFFSLYIFYGGYNILYSMNCHENSQNLFGCCDLRKSKYCILNKQYSKSEYEALVPKIVEHMRKTGEWGEFFPIYLSPFGYNQSLAHEFYPIDRDSAGAKWSDYENPAPQVKEVIDAGALADNIAEFSPDCAIGCEVTGKVFRIEPRELSFLQTHGLPIPRVHPEQRHRERTRRLNPRKLWMRTCEKTGQEIISSYPPESAARVFSEDAFLQELR